MQRRLMGVLGAVAAVGAFALSAGPVFGAAGGSVTASVSVQQAAEACLLITGGPSSIDFGTLAFGGPAGAISATNGALSVTSCAATTETITALGSNATGNGSPAAQWSLDVSSLNPCQIGPNVFHMSAALGTGAALQNLTSSQAPATLGTLTAQQTKTLTQGLVMPCAGSTGAGQTMSFTYGYTATL